MAKTAILVGIISMIMMQSVSDASKINYNQDDVENADKGRIEQKYLYAKLYVKGKANNLADKDPGAAGQVDPYMEVIATTTYGYKQTLYTVHRGGTNNPVWGDWLKFQERTWKKITVKVWDDDGWKLDDVLCPYTDIGLESGGSKTINCSPGGTLTVEWKHVFSD